ncbi:MAG: DUF3393 domain-containing protein [candidate division Zixibacteria bacterium]|nr:DUF3393 domain-containing protein [candidate division Zixibacteria bacterium]
MKSRQIIQRMSIFLILTGLVILISSTMNASKAQQTYENFVEQDQKAYADFEREEAEKFAKYVVDVEKKWNEFKNSTRKDWYEYSHDLNTLSRVDFVEGVITIETIVEKDVDDVMALAKVNIAQQIEGLFHPDSLTCDVILEGQVEFSSPPIIDSTNAAVFIDEKVLPNAKIEEETIKSEDGQERVKVTVSIKMVPNHLQLRAKKYLPTVRKYCQEYNLDVPLVLAIMQTESHFNPRAKSPVPAFGLMQLVPRSGAREAYRFAHNEDKIVRPNYLYDPDNNIHLGCAYLAKMRDNEFKNVNNEDKIRYCIVASYNTGPGNLSKAIVGARVIKPAVKKINEMDSNQLFEKLKTNLPYQETRDYIVKVEECRINYLEWQ